MGVEWEKGPTGELLAIETVTPSQRVNPGGLWAPGPQGQRWLSLLALCGKDGYTFGILFGSSQTGNNSYRAPVLPWVRSTLEPCPHRPSLTQGSQSTCQRVDKYCCPRFVAGESKNRAVKGKITRSQEEAPGVKMGLFSQRAPLPAFTIKGELVLKRCLLLRLEEEQQLSLPAVRDL